MGEPARDERRASGIGGLACNICGDTEPFHVHDGDRRIDDYFTVGRGQTDFTAAQAWRERALKAEARQVTDEMVERLAVYFLNEHRSKTGIPPANSLNILTDLGQEEWRHKARAALLAALNVEGEVDRG
jgi:hypothetical protein